MAPHPILVVGAGPAGLAAADRIARAGHPVQVLEAAGEISGRTGQVKVGDFRFDRGAEFFTNFFTSVRALVREKGLEPEVVEIRGPGALLVKGVLHPMVTGAISALSTSLLSLKSKIRLSRLSATLVKHMGLLDLSEPSTLAGADDESAEDYGRSVLGDEFVECLMKPGMESLTLAPIRETSKALFLAQAQEGPRARFYSLVGGMGRLAERLAEGVPVALGSRATALRLAGDEVEVDVQRDGHVESHRAKSLVLAIPAPQALELLAGLGAPALSAFLSSVRYTPCVKANLGLDRPLSVRHPGVIPIGPEHRGIAGLQFLGWKGTRQVPEGTDGIGVVSSGDLARELLVAPDERVLEVLTSKAKAILGEIPNVVARAVVRIPLAVPQFPPGRYRELVKLEASAVGRVFLAGDYLAGPSVEAAVRTGQKAAARALAAAGGS